MGENRKKLIDALNVIAGECEEHGFCEDCPISRRIGCTLFDRVDPPYTWDTESMVKQEE